MIRRLGRFTRFALPGLAALAALALSLALPGCASLPSDDAPVDIRVENASDVRFHRVEVGFPDEEVDFGSIAPGFQSAYHEVARAYEYARIMVETPADTLRMQPIDFVGEALLEPGQYTYVIGLAEDRSQLTLTLRRDA